MEIAIKNKILYGVMTKKIPVWDVSRREILKWIEVEKFDFEDILYKLLEELITLREAVLDIKKYDESFHIVIKIGTKIVSEYFLFIDQDEIIIEKRV
jgi:hypothetical protein